MHHLTAIDVDWSGRSRSSARREARNTAAAATSRRRLPAGQRRDAAHLLGGPGFVVDLARPRACAPATPATRCGSTPVATMPGHSALARMPCGARSRAAHWVKLITAALAALYGGSVGDPIWPATEDRKQKEPRRCCEQVRHEGVRGVHAGHQVDAHDVVPVRRLHRPERHADLARADADRDDDVVARAQLGRRRRRAASWTARVVGRVDDHAERRDAVRLAQRWRRAP